MLTTTYDVSLAQTGTDDMPLVEEADVTLGRLVEIMRTALTGDQLRPVAHEIVQTSSHPFADGSVATLKVWRLTHLDGDTFDLAIGTLTAAETVEPERLSLVQLQALERKTWDELVTALDLGQNVEVARRTHEAVVDRCTAAQTAVVKAKRHARPNQAHVDAYATAAYTSAERTFERTVYGD